MAKVMMTVRVPEKVPSLRELQERFSLADDEVDAEFGVVEIDPEERLFTFLVDESAATRCSSSGDWEVQGPFSNPRIAPFWPPERPPDE